MSLLSRLNIDPFTVGLLGAVFLGSVLPAQGVAKDVLSYATVIAIALMFFFYGARLSREAVVQGMTHWRLHVTALLSSFVLFPLLGLATGLLVPRVLTPELQAGILFVCLLPSTVQSSIAFTSIARGNVAAAICQASACNLIGVFLTPFLVGIFLSTRGAPVSIQAVESIVLQLLLPFGLGQLARPWVSAWVGRHRRLVTLTDRGSIILIVYAAFGAAVSEGIWHQIPLSSLAIMVAVNAALLIAVLTATTWVSRVLGFSREDEIAIVFCGSKKSLATGVPMASVLFSGPAFGLAVLPLMLFHQLQLIACAILARRYARRQAETVPAFVVP